MQTSSWIDLTENQGARQAVERVWSCVANGRPRRTINPLFLHGPTGSGKTHLIHDLTTRLMRARPEAILSVRSASDLRVTRSGAPAEDESDWKAADLVVLEDVQHLPARAIETLVSLIDHCLPRQRQLVFTATLGPALLTDLPARLTSRLSHGLVIALAAPGPESRAIVLRKLARQRSLVVTDAVLDWLAEHTPGSIRQLEGALTRLITLARGLGHTPGLAEVQAAFALEGDQKRPSLERIVRQVSRYYQIDPDDLCSRGRSRRVLLPRQVSMYLARQLTDLPLEQIGAYFGGRDHSTVLHACRKVEASLDQKDARLTGAVRTLHADLG